MSAVRETQSSRLFAQGWNWSTDSSEVVNVAYLAVKGMLVYLRWKRTVLIVDF